MADASIVQGGTFDFFVEATNKFGEIVPINDAAVALDDASLGDVGVNSDGTAGQFISSGLQGVEGMVPSAGGMIGTPFSLEITQDLAVAGVRIVQAGAGPVTNVRIVRKGAAVRRR